MARTAPAPNIPPIPGMCPSIAVLAGGGDMGNGSGGDAGDGSGDDNAGAGKGGENAEADGRGAPDYEKYPECGYASHPVDVVTGRAFTHPVVDLALPGPLPLRFRRMYSSKMAGRDVGLGFGWGHTFGWEVEVRRRSIVVWNEQGVGVDFPLIRPGDEVIGPWGWVLRRETWGFAVDADDGLWHLFSAEEDGGKRYRLTAIEDRNRNRIALTYEDGHLSEVHDSAGRQIRFRSTREGRIAAIETQNAASQGRWVAFGTYTYDEHGNLVSAVDADGHTARYAYDEDHRLTADQDRTGLTFHFVYDREGRCVEAWGDYPGRRDPSLSDGVPKWLADQKTRVKGIHHCRFEYHADGYSEVADSTQVRRYFGTKHGTLSKAVEGGGVTTAVYRDDGHLMARTDPTGGTWSFDRDARGRLLKRTDPLGRVSVLDRDANGLPVCVTNAAGGVTEITRDAHGNILTYTDAAGATSSYRYDERGLMVEEISGTGGRTTWAFDAQGNLVAQTAPNGATFRFTYDALGRCLSRTDPTGAETRFAYSARGDLIEVRDALGGVTRYAHDGEGHLIQVVDAKGGVTQLGWGGYQQVCERRDANGNAVRLRYNLEGELVEVHNERGEVHRLQYSTYGLLTSETTFDGRELHYRHDKAGRLVRAQNGAREATSYEYDLAGQLVKKELHDGSIEEYSYDGLGNVIGAVWPGGEVRFERDALGRVVREIQIANGKEHTVDVSYDANGGRVGRGTSLGHTEAVTRGPLGERVRTVLDGAHAVDHQTNFQGRETARALPGGGWLQSAHDAMGRVARRRAGGTPAGSWGRAGEPEWLGERPERLTVDTSYRYDEVGERIEAWDRTHGPTQYTYDPVGQLLSRVPEKARAELFHYDPAGNLHETGAGAEAREYGPGNRLLRKGDWDYRWDGEGRLVERRRRLPSGEDEVWRYAWNGAGLLQEVERPDGVKAAFTYDPFARRLAKRVTQRGASGRLPVSETRFVWDGNALVHEIHARAQAAGDPVVEERTFWFEDGGFEPLAHREVRRDTGAAKGAWFHYVNDPIGTPERLLAEDGSVACEMARRAWGDTGIVGTPSATTPFRLQGQYADEETGLAYNRFRYAFAGGDVFCSPDPLGLIAGTHAYRTVWNPFAWMDPFGLATMRQAEDLLNASENRPFPGGSNIGHANWHVPPPGANTAAAHAASRGNANNTTFRNRNQAIRALRNCMTENEAALAALPEGETLGGNYTPPETLDGEHSANGQPATRVAVNRVSYRIGKLPGGDLHLLHFQPHGS